MASKFIFENYSESEFKIMDRNIRQAYRMVDFAIKQLITAIGILGTSSRNQNQNYSYDMNGLLKSALIEFGGNDIKALGEAKSKLLDIKNKFRRGGMTLIRHDSKGEHKNRNTIAEAEKPGKKQWYGPLFFDRMTDSLNSRPRVVIHEFGHSVGLDHEFQGIASTADKSGKVRDSGIAQVAIGADGLALFCYRLYARRYTKRMELMHFD